MIEFEWTKPFSCYYEFSIFCQDYQNKEIQKAVLDSITGKGFCGNLISGSNYSIIAQTNLIKEGNIFKDTKFLTSIFTG